ncbi:MAG: bifunctional oligoribonuclease/PAP phosphatase NrnA [Firmicutes bacterium]|nr:bifunctional oligoribonuclease/PAP phosphatase NrnA [Bacillota bacterium]MBQ3123650.1 bifunctional oligoribonuclease/PAP phosphatase NrnA [Bacillota bacterium]MBQ9972478.1 bifunctional oligoribonuclease/PAP phosphatase NrnA [Bacillota bacterium]
MNTKREMAELLAVKNRILIFPHVHMDGDALGTGAGLCCALRKLGKEAYILIEDEIGDNLQFIDDGFCVRIEDGETPDAVFEKYLGKKADLCIMVDCGSPDRFEKRKEVFFAGEVTGCIDHHGTSKPIADYNFIDAGAAACAEIMYDILRELEDVTGADIIDKQIADALFSGIMTDTGCFVYSNTTIHTHEVAIELMKKGVDSSAISANIYESDSFAKIRLNGMAVDAMRVFADGQAAITIVTQDMLKECGAVMNDAEGVVDTLRSIKGVEIAVFLKELAENEIKVSMRAKSYANVAVIASEFGGGGHIRAAGCTLRMPAEEALKTMISVVTEALGTQTKPE